MKPKKKKKSNRGGAHSHGRPAGCPNKSTLAIKERVCSIVDFDKMTAELQVMFYDKTLPVDARIKIAKHLYAYGHGLPPQQLNVKGDGDKTLYQITLGGNDTEKD